MELTEGAEIHKHTGSLAADQQTHATSQQRLCINKLRLPSSCLAADKQTNAPDQQTQAAEGLFSVQYINNPPQLSTL